MTPATSRTRRISTSIPRPSTPASRDALPSWAPLVDTLEVGWDAGGVTVYAGVYYVFMPPDGTAAFSPAWSTSEIPVTRTLLGALRDPSVSQGSAGEGSAVGAVARSDSDSGSPHRHLDPGAPLGLRPAAQTPQLSSGAGALNLDLPRMRDGELKGAMWSITTNPLRTRRGRWTTFLRMSRGLTA